MNSKLLVTNLSRVKASRFGGLRTRRLPDGKLLGDISILHEHLPPRTCLPRIHHNRTAEFVYCLAGTMTAILGRRKYRVNAGDILLIPKKVRHQFKTHSKACEAISIFAPALIINKSADIHKS